MKNKGKFQILQGVENRTPNFNLTVMELYKYLSPEFGEVKRIYWVDDFCGSYSAGGHCHIIENELMALLTGTATAEIDDGSGLQEIEMTPGMVLYVGNHVWHYFKNFSPDAILLCIASTNYNPNRSDYIADYEKFREIICP